MGPGQYRSHPGCNVVEHPEDDVVTGDVVCAESLLSLSESEELLLALSITIEHWKDKAHAATRCNDMFQVGFALCSVTSVRESGRECWGLMLNHQFEAGD